VRGDLQALDLEDLQSLLSRGDVIYEGNPTVGGWLFFFLRSRKARLLFLKPRSAASL
jgi:hypothetical protein